MVQMFITMLSKFLAVTIALAAAQVANAVNPYVVTRSTTIVNHDGTDYYRQVFSVELSDTANERVNGLLNTDAAFDAASDPESYSVSFSASSTTYPLSRASSGTIAPDTDIVFARDSGTFQATGAPIGSYWAPGVADAATLQTIKNTCSGAATMTGGWPTNVAPWGSTTDVDKGFTFSISADAACAALTQDSGSGVVLGVMVSESPVSFVRFMISVYNVNDASSRLLVLESAFDTDTTGPLADYVCIDKVYSGSSMNPTIYANNALAAYDSSSGACSTYTPPAGLQKGCDDVWSLTPTVNDACGVCGGDDSTCTGCMDDNFCNFDASATIADNSQCEATSCLGCDGVLYLAKNSSGVSIPVNDTCGVCGGDGTSCVQPCSFHAPGTLFPADLIYITENSNGDSTDATVKLTFNWNSSKEAADTNYYLLDAKSSGSAFDQSLGDIALNDLLNSKSVLSDFQPVGFPDFNLNSTSPGAVADSTGTGGGTISSSISADGHAGQFVYEGPDQDVLIMIGAASTCVTSRETVDYVYIRSVYKFRVKERLSMEKTVDDSGFASYVAQYNNDVQGRDPILVTQADLTQNLQTFNAQHVMKTRNLEVHSNLAGPAGHDCLGANNNAQASYSESNGDTTVSVNDANSAVTCTITRPETSPTTSRPPTTATPPTTTIRISTRPPTMLAKVTSRSATFTSPSRSPSTRRWPRKATTPSATPGTRLTPIGMSPPVTPPASGASRTGQTYALTSAASSATTSADRVPTSRRCLPTLKSAWTPMWSARSLEQNHTGVAVNDAARQGTYALNDEARPRPSPVPAHRRRRGRHRTQYPSSTSRRFDCGKGALQSDYARRLRNSKQLSNARTPCTTCTFAWLATIKSVVSYLNSPLKKTQPPQTRTAPNPTTRRTWIPARRVRAAGHQGHGSPPGPVHPRPHWQPPEGHRFVPAGRSCSVQGGSRPRNSVISPRSSGSRRRRCASASCRWTRRPPCRPAPAPRSINFVGDAVHPDDGRVVEAHGFQPHGPLHAPRDPVHAPGAYRALMVPPRVESHERGPEQQPSHVPHSSAYL